jgi:quercetin dioxygenase-like cupin family protein
MYSVKIEDVPRKPGLKIASGLMDQHILGAKDGHHHLKGAEKTYVLVQTYSPGGRHNPHTHPAAEQVFIVLQGRGEMRIGGKVHALEKGTIAYAPRDVEHSTENTGDEDLVMVLIGVSLE